MLSTRSEQVAAPGIESDQQPGRWKFAVSLETGDLEPEEVPIELGIQVLDPNEAPGQAKEPGAPGQTPTPEQARAERHARALRRRGRTTAARASPLAAGGAIGLAARRWSAASSACAGGGDVRRALAIALALALLAPAAAAAQQSAAHAGRGRRLVRQRAADRARAPTATRCSPASGCSTGSSSRRARSSTSPAQLDVEEGALDSDIASALLGRDRDAAARGRGARPRRRRHLRQHVGHRGRQRREARLRLHAGARRLRRARRHGQLPRPGHLVRLAVPVLHRGGPGRASRSR